MNRPRLRSQSGPLAGAGLMATPSHDATRIDPHLFRVLLLSRLHLICLCPLSLAPAGVAVHSIRLATTAQRAVEFWADGGLQLRALAHEFAMRGGARVSTDLHVRDLDILAPEVHDGRRIEIIAEGLPLFGGAQLAVDLGFCSSL